MAATRRGRRPGLLSLTLLARCWTGQQLTVDRDDVNRSRQDRCPQAGRPRTISPGLFPVVRQRYD